MRQPTQLFPEISSPPTSIPEAINTLFQTLYIKVFMSGYTEKPSTGFYFLISQRLDNIQRVAINFLRTTNDQLLNKHLTALLNSVSVNNTIPQMSLIFLITKGDRTNSVFTAISEWLILCYTDAPCGDITLPVVTINPDMSVSISTSLLNIDVSENDFEDISSLPPFWRWLSYIVIGYSDVQDPFSAICTEVLPYVALPLAPATLANDVGDKQIPLPNLINILISLDVLFPQDPTISVSDDGFRRIMWSRWLKGISPEVCLVGGDVFIIWSRLFDGITIGSTWARLQSALTELTRPYQRASMSSSFDNIALEAASMKSKDDVDDPSEDPDAADTDGSVGDNTSNDIDSTAGTGGMVTLADQTSVSNDQNSNAIGETGNTATQKKAAIQLGDSSTGNPVNAYLYRRSVLAVNKLLETDGDLAVSHDARESLADWCRQWLWVADVSQTQKLIRELGLQKLVTQVKV